MNKLFYLKVCKELIYSDLKVFKQTVLGKLIDLTIWVTLTLFVTGYIMPYFGLSNNFGTFQVGGVLAAAGLFELYTSVIDLVDDFEGNKIINYSLTLPIPSWLAILSKTIYFFIISLFLTLCMIPVAKICLWNQLDLTQINYFKLLMALISANIFYGSFTIWASSITKNMQTLGSIWARFIFPMWFLGGFQFSWAALYKAIPVIAYINLINPMIYITESIRTAILGQNDYLNFWLCIGAILIFAITFFILGLQNLKKRLDFI